MVEIVPTTSVGEFGEHRLIAAIAQRIGTNDSVLVGVGDDAAVVPISDPRLVASTDLYVQDRHFRLNWSSAHDIGRKVAAASLADVYAMGAVGAAIVVGLVLPASAEVTWVLELADGLAAECETVGTQVVGGDISAGDSIVICSTALGDLQGRQPVTRRGARPGDIVAIAGNFGWSAAGLAVLMRGFSSPRAVVNAHRCPQPPYLAGPLAASAGATAMLDISDGLVSDLGHIALASGVSIDIESTRVPIADQILQAASAFNVDPLQWVLSGGEDHGFAATFPSGVALPADFVPIGRVSDEDPGLVSVDGQPRPDLQGFDHFA